MGNSFAAAVPTHIYAISGEEGIRKTVSDFSTKIQAVCWLSRLSHAFRGFATAVEKRGHAALPGEQVENVTTSSA